MNFPQPTGDIPAAIKAYLSRLIQSLQQNDNNTLKKDVPQGSVLLVSPNRSVYSVKVTDAGILTTEKLYDAS